MTGEVTIRRAVVPDDDAAIVDLLRTTMGWAAGDQAERLFRWKHQRNPAGVSPIWLAECDGQLIGLRAFLRWDFVRAGQALRAVRAVDTVTHPDHRGRGLFTTMTLGAIEALRAEGVDFVFNTPNAQSLPGYKKMGWQEVGALDAFVRIRSIGAIPAVVRSRGPADLDSLPCLVGVAASATFGDPAAELAISRALEASVPPPDDTIRTARSVDHLRWRYAEAPLGYRVWASRDGLADGFVVFRLRRRVRAVEATIADVIVPGGDPRQRTALVTAAARATGADYAIVVGGRPSRRWMSIGSGPLLTVRDLAGAAPTAPSAWSLTMGDIELF